jgi:hypothetical protein
MDKVTEFSGAPWSLVAVEKLKELWNEGVSVEIISATLGRSEAVVRAKAAELSLPQHVSSRRLAG